jgi:ABC-type phosphate/phosphonate transport system ATPase subunit
MIELLGVGVPRRNGGWLLHRVCATLEAGELTTVLSADAEERRALLDAVAGRRLPHEGRVWIDRVPVMPESLGRVHRLCGGIDPADGLVPRRSVFWNALAPASGPRALGRLLRLPRRRERDAVRGALERVELQARLDDPVSALSAFERLRLVVARALARRPHYLVVRDPDTALSADEAGALLGLLRLLARSDRLGVVVSLADGASSRGLADRVLRLHEGVLLSPGRLDAPGRPPAAWRAVALAR